METKTIRFINVLMILVVSFIYIYGMPSPQFSNMQINKARLEQNSQRNLEETDDYDSYIVLTYNATLNYTDGFLNEVRDDISYLINRDDNSKLLDTDPLEINPGTEIEVHFSSPIKNLSLFFSSYYDDMMFYLVSIDFSHFDSSLVVDMDKMFAQCYELKSIDFSNINTSNLKTMDRIFVECVSLESIDISNFNTSSLV